MTRSKESTISNASSEHPPVKKSEFLQKLESKWNQGYFVSVGLDPDLRYIPEFLKSKYISGENAVAAFNREIIDATGDIACSFKLNSAFYESLWDAGGEILMGTIEYAKQKFPNVLIIDDAKRGDIGHTNEKYVESIFDQLGADAVTVHPTTGSEAMSPFLKRSDKGVFVLCKTSNEGSDEFQNLELSNGEKLYEATARIVREKWNTNGNVGLVVGATYPYELKRIRDIAPDIPLLIPGVGEQGGDVKEVFLSGKNRNGQGMIISSSRRIIYASDDKNFAQAARKKLTYLNTEIQSFL